jgi:hypothetical protein
MIRSFNNARSALAPRTLSLAALLAAPLLVTTLAHADVTCGDTTCTKGYTCESYQATACPAIASIDGKNVDCAPTTSYSCVPASCATNEDCGDGMVCNTSTSSTCSGGMSKPSCDPAAPDCGAVLEDVPASCESKTVQQCVPRYLLPCKAASDCGTGFTCEEVIETGCSGSGGASSGGAAGVGTAMPTEPQPAPTTSSSGVSAGGAANVGVATGGATVATRPVSATGGASTKIAAPSTDTTADIAISQDPPPTCTSVPTGRYQCVLQTINCNVDADCPAGLTCVSGGSSRDCWASSDGTSGCSAPVEVAKVCQPKYYARLGSDAIATSSGSGEVTTGTQPKQGLPVDDGSDATANGAGARSGATTAGATTDSSANSPTPETVSGGGCVVAHGPQSALGAWMMLLLTLGVGSRARRRNTSGN